MILACRSFYSLTLTKLTCARGQSVTQLSKRAGVTLDIPSIHQYAKLGRGAFPPSSSLGTLLCKLFVQYWEPQRGYRQARKFPLRGEWNAKESWVEEFRELRMFRLEKRNPMKICCPEMAAALFLKTPEGTAKDGGKYCSLLSNN